MARPVASSAQALMQAHSALTKEQRDRLTPAQVLDELKKGNERFRAGAMVARDYRAQQRSSAAAQYPACVALGCVDSRAPAEVIFDVGIGDMEERFPAAFVSRLPVYTPMADTSNEPNRYVYFSEDGALYRVRIISGCTPPDAFYCGTFYALEVDPVPDIDIELLTPAERTYRLLRANGRVGDSETERLDLFANVARLGLRAENRLGTYVWTGAMGLRLADLPPNGATIEREEYERHKAIYVAIQRYQENGMDLIEGDVIFEHVRVCQIEPGVADTCEVK